MIVTMIVFDETIRNAIGGAQIAYWGKCYAWNRSEIVMRITVEGSERRIDREDFQCGLALMAEKHPRKFGELIEGRGDATVGDILIQLACFGEVRYS